MGAEFQTDDVSYVSAWRHEDPRFEADAISMWREMRVLAPDVNPQSRAKELAALAYRNGQLVGITTASIRFYQPLRQNFAFMRMLIRPGEAGAGIDVSLAVKCRETLRLWSKDNPQEQVAGLAATVVNGPYAPFPVLPSGLTMVGYTGDGHQVRVFWWDHFRIQAS